MLHLFDANVLINASNSYYPPDAVPEFWEWISHQATNGFIKLPIEILDEVMAGEGVCEGVRRRRPDTTDS